MIPVIATNVVRPYCIVISVVGWESDGAVHTAEV